MRALVLATIAASAAAARRPMGPAALQSLHGPAAAASLEPPHHLLPQHLAGALLLRGGEKLEGRMAREAKSLREIIASLLPDVRLVSESDPLQASSIAYLGDLAFALQRAERQGAERGADPAPDRDPALWGQLAAVLAEVVRGDEAVINAFVHSGVEDDFEFSSGSDWEHGSGLGGGEVEWGDSSGELLHSQLVSLSGPEARASAAVVLVSIADAIDEEAFYGVVQALHSVDERTLAFTKPFILEPHFESSAMTDATRRVLLALQADGRASDSPEHLRHFCRLSEHAAKPIAQSNRLRRYLFERILEVVSSRDVAEAAGAVRRAKSYISLLKILQNIEVRHGDLAWWEAQSAKIRGLQRDLLEVADTHELEVKTLQSLGKKLRKLIRGLNRGSQ